MFDALDEALATPGDEPKPRDIVELTMPDGSKMEGAFSTKTGDLYEAFTKDGNVHKVKRGDLRILRRFS